MLVSTHERVHLADVILENDQNELRTLHVESTLMQYEYRCKRTGNANQPGQRAVFVATFVKRTTGLHRTMVFTLVSDPLVDSDNVGDLYADDDQRLAMARKSCVIVWDCKANNYRSIPVDGPLTITTSDGTPIIEL